MRVLRLITWNCHHGMPSQRLAELGAHGADIVFLQECLPARTLPSTGSCLTQRVNARKGLALASLNADYHLKRLRARPHRGSAVVGAAVSGPVSFTALGVWSRGPRYVDDVMRTLKAYDRVLRSGPAVVMGDLNSGTNLGVRQSPSAGHARIVAALANVGLVSAYHAFHRVDHGHEAHPTYRHQRNVAKPWHIDFCFVPAGWDGVGVEVLDGRIWAARSEHLSLVDVEFSASDGQAPAQARRLQTGAPFTTAEGVNEFPSFMR
jgi:endonuclease/exonuclease/phosphatase family metal-dependent hydrolase